MRKATWKKWISVLMVAAILACSMPEMVVNAADDGSDEMVEELAVLNGTDSGTTDGEDLYQYIRFPFMGNDIEVTMPETLGVTSIEGLAETTVYRVNPAVAEELCFEASVRLGDKITVPEKLEQVVIAEGEPVVADGRLVYTYQLQLSEVTSSETEPLLIELLMSHEKVSIEINGSAVVNGVDENGYAKIGEEVSVEITEPGYALAKLTKDELGNDVYTAMELDYDNCYVFTVKEGAVFYVVDPEQVDYVIVNSEINVAKITGEKGIKLVSLDSAAQGYDEIVLDFTAVKNGSDGTETEDVYYEVKVNAVQKEGETLPAGSSTTPKYYYIPKVANDNTQSKAIKVNDGVLSAPTAATYEFSVRMVYISKTANVPAEDKAVSSALTVNMTNNTITKQFSTRNPYFEDKLSFKKVNTKVYTGQENVLVGNVKYSANASYIHDLTAVAYDSRGAVCSDIYCTFKNDNDELYVTTSEYIQPGKYTIMIYASVGEEATVNNPQGGTLYQATTSFALTVQEDIYYINTSNIMKEVGVNSKNVSFSAVPVGYTYYTGKKASKQKFSYEIKSVEYYSDGNYKYVEPVEKVKNNVTVNANGKVTINKAYYVDSDEDKNYIAIFITARDYEGNDATGVAIVKIVSAVSVPTTIYLTNSNGNSLGTTISAYQANSARVIVLDQYGNNMNSKVKITPNNSKNSVYVAQYSSGSAYLYVNKPGTVTIKAVTKDGTKKSKSLKVTVTKPTVTQASFSLNSVTYKGINIYDYSTATGYIYYNSPKGTVIKFVQGAEYNNSYYFKDWFDWRYKITGAKVTIKDGVWTVTPTAQSALLTVWDKANPKKTWTLRFVSECWSTTYEKAPKLTLTEGKLYNNKYSNIDNMEYDEYWDEYYVDSQILTYQYDFGSYDQVKITRTSNTAPYLWVESFNPEKRIVNFGASAGTDLKTGTFKYVVSFYKDGELMCNPTTISVKVTKANKVKVTSSYTFDTSASNGVKLKCNIKDFFPDFQTSLLNANVGGKANDFNKYFELVYETDAATGQKVPMIKFKESVTAAEKEALKGTTQTGYVKYDYYFGYDHIQNQTQKITIKVK